MLIKILKNYTVELPDGSAGVFLAGREYELENKYAETVVQKGYAKKAR
jgi:hypothetical protein